MHKKGSKHKNKQVEDPVIPRVYSEPYFYGRITRQEAEDILTLHGKENGLYLLRESISPMGNFSLTMAHDGNIVHYAIEKKIDGQYMIADGVAFPDPVALIQYYQTHKNGFVTVPKIPCKRRADQEAVAFRGLSYKDLHAHMKEVASEMNANMSQAFGPKRESLLMHVLQTMHTKMPWYHGQITRDECIKRLEEDGHEDGKFIVRQRLDAQTYALTVSCDKQSRHYFIIVNDGETFSIENGQRFKALIILVDHYHNKRDGLPCKLRVPCPNPDVKVQEFEHYMKLHRNLTRKPGSMSTVDGARPPPAHRYDIDGGVPLRPAPPIPGKPRDRPPPPIPTHVFEENGAFGGFAHFRNSSDIWDEIGDSEEPLEEDDSSANVVCRTLSHIEAQELESVYVDIREDVLAGDVRPEQITLEGKLGSGQFGEVRKGVCRLHRKSVPVAVKTLKNNDPTGEREILQEANLMKKLDHQHIVRMIGVCKGESLMLVMELAELGPLKKHLERHRDMKVWHLVEMMVQICDGMTYLESMEIVHRDLATRNVLLVTEHFAKISDFGMSRTISNTANYYMAHGPGRWPLMWYAPECLYYHKFDSKSDVWSFGVTLWEIMSFGQRPYDRKKPQEILHYIESGNRLRKPKDCDERIYTIMLSCWEWTKEKRPPFYALKPQLEALYKEFKTANQ